MTHPLSSQVDFCCADMRKHALLEEDEGYYDYMVENDSVGYVMEHDGKRFVRLGHFSVIKDEWCIEACDGPGYTIMDGVKFCPWCGRPLDDNKLKEKQ
jgi:hypothetical protein